MTIKKTFTLFFLLVSFLHYGQNESMRAKKDQVKAMKIAFITSELNLTSDEAIKFWPAYKLYEDKLFELRHQKMMTYNKKLKDGSLDNMTDKEALAFLNQIESVDEEQYLVRKKFNATLRNILSPSKILKLRKSEIDFDRRLLQQYRKRN